MASHGVSGPGTWQETPQEVWYRDGFVGQGGGRLREAGATLPEGMRQQSEAKKA